MRIYLYTHIHLDIHANADINICGYSHISMHMATGTASHGCQKLVSVVQAAHVHNTPNRYMLYMPHIWYISLRNMLGAMFLGTRGPRQWLHNKANAIHAAATVTAASSAVPIHLRTPPRAGAKASDRQCHSWKLLVPKRTSLTRPKLGCRVASKASTPTAHMIIFPPTCRQYNRRQLRHNLH